MMLMRSRTLRISLLAAGFEAETLQLAEHFLPIEAG